MNITIDQGATFQREFSVSDSQGALALDGYTVRGTLRANAGDVAAAFACTATDNKILIELTATQTAGLPASTVFSHRYDVEAESPQGIVYRIAQGQAVISAEQTK